MGNCSQNFQNIRQDDDPFAHSSFQNKPRINQQHHDIKSDAPYFVEKPQEHVLDHEVIHSSFVRAIQPPVIVEEKQKTEDPVPFPEISAPSEPSILPGPPKQKRQVLEELDFNFYHSLALPDYEYPPIPENEKSLFKGVQTYEMKDNYGVKYVGEWQNNNIHGNGVLLSNTSKYIGQFKYGLKHYNGRQILKNQVYEGSFDGGRRKGQGVRYTPTSTERGIFDDTLVEGEIIYLDGKIQKKTKPNPKIDLMEQLQKDKKIKAQPLIDGSLYTQNYYQASELPLEWYDKTEPQRLAKV